jgi:hypothetical protein
MNSEAHTATALFDPGRHEALIEMSWDADAARAAIERIVEARIGRGFRRSEGLILLFGRRRRHFHPSG